MPKRLSVTPPPKMTAASVSTMHPMLKYFLIITLVILLGFTVVYIYNVVRYSRNMEKFSDVVPVSKQFVLIYSDTCGHCERFMQTWNPVVEKMQQQPQLKGVAFNKYEHTTAGAEQFVYNDQGVQINGFPTVLYVESGKIKQTLVGNVDEAQVANFINQSAA